MITKLAGLPCTALLALSLAFSCRAQSPDTLAGPVTQLRGKLDNCRFAFQRDRRGTVAFLGGSITEMDGYRVIVADMLEERFPETEFTFVNAGVASTCSVSGAFRLADEVLRAKPDLVLVEFAVNDDQDAAYDLSQARRGMEGIVRQLRQVSPHCDVIMTHFTNPSMLKTIEDGRQPISVQAHQQVAQHYGVSTNDVGQGLVAAMRSGALSWSEYGGVHPAPPGNRFAARGVAELLDKAWQEPLAPDATRQAHTLPAPLDRYSYASGRKISPAAAKVISGWRYETPGWDQIAGNCRNRFRDLKLLVTETPGAALSLRFEGTAAGAFVLAGPDAGTLQTRVDGGPWHQVPLDHRFSKNLHYPRTVMFADDLEAGRHQLEIRLAEPDGEEAPRRAARILHFSINGAPADSAKQ